jgi:hypothetical protein
VADITSLDLVGGRDTGHTTGGATTLLLDDDDDTVTCGVLVNCGSISRGSREVFVGLYRTDSGMSFLADDQDAFDKGSARVVDAVKHCLPRLVRK